MKAATRYATILCLSIFYAAEAPAADWIVHTRQACSTAGEGAAKCESSVALVRAAMAAAVSATNGGNGNGASDHRALDAAAAAVAASVVLERLYAEQQPEFEMRLAVMLADIPESQAKADALARGRRIATQILHNR